MRSSSSRSLRQLQHDGAVVTQGRNEIRYVDVNRQGAAPGGYLDDPSPRYVVDERVRDASAYRERDVVASARLSLDDTELPVASEDSIPDESCEMIVPSVQTTRGTVSESRLMVFRRPRTRTR